MLFPQTSVWSTPSFRSVLFKCYLIRGLSRPIQNSTHTSLRVPLLGFIFLPSNDHHLPYISVSCLAPFSLCRHPNISSMRTGTMSFLFTALSVHRHEVCSPELPVFVNEDFQSLDLSNGPASLHPTVTPRLPFANILNPFAFHQTCWKTPLLGAFRCPLAVQCLTMMSTRDSPSPSTNPVSSGS